MASPIQLKNNAVGRLTSGVSSLATTLILVSGDGAKFPTLTGTQYFPATLIRASDSAVEIVKVTARSGDVLTVVRAQEGTSGLVLLAGDRVELRFTAGTLTDEVARIEAIAQDAEDAASDAAAAAAAAQSTANSALSLASAAAPDTSVVKLTGDQTIAGVKTFSSSPVIPAATTSTQATNKGQMDTAISTVVAAAVAPATIAPTLFVETSPRTLSGLSAVEWTVPSWARCITVIVVDASGAASGVAALRIGTGTIETTGYTGCCTEHSGNTLAANSTLWNLATSAGAGDSFTFFATIQRSHNNYWVYESSGSPTNSSNNMTGCGQKSLSGALQTVQLLIAAGDAFDSGVATLYYR